MALQNPPRPAYNDEIDLRQLATTLWSRRALISVITLIFAIIAGTYSFLAPKMYESQVMIQVSNQSAPAYASPAAAARIFGSLTFLEQVAGAADLQDRPGTLRPRVMAEPVRDTPFVRVRVRARSPGDAQRLADTVAKVFVAQASEQIMERRRTVEQRLAAVNAQLADIQGIIAMSRQTLAQLQARRPLTGEQEGFIRTFTLNAIGISEGLYSGLVAAQKDLTVELLDLKPPKLIEEPTFPGAPSTPRPALNISLAVILGVSAAIIGVIGLEALRGAGRIAPAPQV